MRTVVKLNGIRRGRQGAQWCRNDRDSFNGKIRNCTNTVGIVSSRAEG